MFGMFAVSTQDAHFALERNCRYLVEGVTEDGQKFRPSDWIDRIASMDATYEQHRLVYSDHVHPENFNGQKCLMVHSDLEHTNPDLFKYLMQFITSNKLRITRLCDLPAEDSQTQSA